VGRHSVDVHRFRAKAAEARANTDDGVAPLARAALLEWGPGPAQLYGPEPLAGLPGQWAADYRLTLRREHRDLLIELLAAELRRGGAKRVLAEFARLADADEVAREDEQLTALLMHAYYLCGRQSEALKAYQRTIESLKQKGVEAGRELRMLEKKVRNQDPDLDYPRAAVIEPRDLAHTGEQKNDDQGGDASIPDAGTDPGDSGPVRANSKYSQRNIGRTVIANQGTQHVRLGGSDE
jgi:DNA-binding SARP family transcriptional activator